MIFIEITGNKGEGAYNSLLAIIQSLTVLPDTNKVLVLDCGCGRDCYNDKSDKDITIKDLESNGELKDILINPDKLYEKICFIRPYTPNYGIFTPNDVSFFVKEVLKKIKPADINCNEKNYCLLQNWSI